MKLYCKKTYKLEFYFKIPKVQFRKGETYEGEKVTVKRIGNLSLGANPINPIYYDIIEVYSDDNRHINFALEKNCPYQQLYLKDYFYSEKEMRKRKLDRLNNPFYRFLSLFK